MRRGKFLIWFAVFSATVGAVYQWYLGRLLDALAAAKGGPVQRVWEVLMQLGTFTQIAFGISAGIMIALLIGYWEAIVSGVVGFFGRLFSRRSTWGEYLICRGEVTFAPGEQVVSLHAPGVIGSTMDRIYIQPESWAFCKFLAKNEINLQRIGNRDGQKITYEVWGWRPRPPKVEPLSRRSPQDTESETLA